MFKVDCIVINGHDVANLFIIGKIVENFFESSTHQYVYDRGFKDPFIFVIT